ncbi:LigA protein [Streptomyces himastatinicus ATCC 53653]|uniref:LigA protein n=1 Tax=Streptomyces himastatinicus ATCC 53653 TaxID=457427 RepID=D9WPL7_9ACTN|nr:hypothetical protein [Streptomyces himastatinicus]EFL21882.1 LigA protein [Streptomyces himastatinicus ATCC 53653]
MDVTIPGALADHLAAQYIGDEETAAALDAARRGRGRTLVIEPTSTRVLHVISRHAEHILSIRGAHTRAQVDAARLWIKRAGHAPAILTHRFEDTEEAYNATQCRDDIRDGDVLIIEREGVVGFLRSAWPAAITAEHGELHSVDGDPRTLDDGRYAASIEDAEQIAREHGFALATEQQLDAVEAKVAEQFHTTARATDAVEYAEQVEAGVETVADAEALYAAQLVTEADATDGTWRGEWIGQHPDDGLFTLEPAADQGALFDDRAAALAADRAALDAHLARTYPALFAPEQPRPLELEPALIWAVTHHGVIRGEWQGFFMCGLGRREAENRARALRYTGSKDVQVVPCEHGPHSHRDARIAARCEGCGYPIPTGEEWHEGCRPRPRPTPLDRARLAAERDAGYARALEASARVAYLDDEPPF